MKRPLALLVFASACTTPSDDLSVVASAVNWAEPDCPHDVCGMNGNNMGWYFNELDLDHEPNNAQVVFVQFDNLPSVVHHVDVRDDRLVPVSYAGSDLPPTLLLNVVIVLSDKDGDIYRVRIAGLNNSAQFWAANEGVPFWSYTLRYVNISEGGTHQREQAFCDAEPLAGPAVQSDAVFFKGDRYNAVTKAITPATDPSWFNVACLGSVPAKMFMMRHAEASSDPVSNVETNNDERLALINAWTGNYCGDGRSFTHSGEPVRMRDDKGWILHTSGWSWSSIYKLESNPISSYDALWDRDGAVCLDVPRLADTEPDTYDDIQAHCEEVRGKKIPRCTKQGSEFVDWEKRGHILTANPTGS